MPSLVHQVPWVKLLSAFISPSSVGRGLPLRRPKAPPPLDRHGLNFCRVLAAHVHRCQGHTDEFGRLRGRAAVILPPHFASLMVPLSPPTISLRLAHLWLRALARIA